MERPRFEHLHLLLTGSMGQAELPEQGVNEGDGFVGGLVNGDMVLNPANVPPVQDLIDRYLTGFGNYNGDLQRFVTAAYDDEQTERADRDLLVEPLIANQFVFICQVLLQNPTFNHYLPLRQRSTALIGPPGTGKTKTIMSLIAATYCSVQDGGQSAITTELRRQQWQNAAETGLGLIGTVGPLMESARGAHLPKILLVAPTNRAVDVLEERLQQGFPVWDVTRNAWTHVTPIYRRVGNEEVDNNERVTRRRNAIIPNALVGFGKE